jgi:hypothetical protein
MSSAWATCAPAKPLRLVPSVGSRQFGASAIVQVAPRRRHRALMVLVPIALMVSTSLGLLGVHLHSAGAAPRAILASSVNSGMTVAQTTAWNNTIAALVLNTPVVPTAAPLSGQLPSMPIQAP